MRVLADVDGVFADLMGGFKRYFYDEYGEILRPQLMTVHAIDRSPVHADLHERFDLKRCLADFLSLPSVYQRWVRPIDGALNGVSTLLMQGHEVGFVTATYGRALSSYESKVAWLNGYYPDIPVLAVSAEQKHWVMGDFGIDDRFDTCESWRRVGVRPLLFRQPWNEAPPGTPSYDWRGVLDVIFNR